MEASEPPVADRSPFHQFGAPPDWGVTLHHSAHPVRSAGVQGFCGHMAAGCSREWPVGPRDVNLPCPNFPAKHQFPPGLGIFSLLLATTAAAICVPRPHSPVGAVGPASSWRVLSKETFRIGILVHLS